MKKWILPILLVLMIAAAAVLLLLPANGVSYDGTSVYTDEELNQLIFGTDSPRYYYARIREIFRKHREIPFLARYDVVFEEGRNIRVHLYEKSLAGYLRFQNYYLYFDWDGVLVEIGTQRVEGMYEVKGLSVEHAVKGEVLPLKDSGVLHTMLTLTQFLNRETIYHSGREILLGSLCSGICFKSDGVELEMGGITVFLGDTDNVEGKLYAMEDILPELAGKQGTLYLDSYRSGAVDPRYIFKEN
ncbi:MAG: hypothetical protein J5496_02785 [Lachnospiraceae bacterium]|nr:hypothetical protein [Lachnospiraceae bacterium]